MINEKSESLEDFGWGAMTPETDFFAQTEEVETPTDVKSVIKEISKDDVVVGSDNDKLTDKGQPEETDLFAQTSANVSTEIVDNNGSGEGNDDDSDLEKAPNTFILNKLKEKGFIDYELEEGEELTEELAEELLEDKFDESVETKVKELMTDLPDDKKDAIQFLIKGGDLSELVEALNPGDVSINIDADLEKEENQISEMRKLLKLEDNDNDEIEAQIEFLKDSGKLKLMVEKKLNKYKEGITARKAELLKKQDEDREAEKKNIKEAKAKLVTFLTETEEVEGIKFSKDDKKVLPSYMNDKVVKLNNGTAITQMQKELFYDLPKNEKALVQLAALLRNRNADGTFNFDSIAKSTQTKVTKAVKDNIRRKESSIPGNSITKQGKSEQSLADYFG